MTTALPPLPLGAGLPRVLGMAPVQVPEFPGTLPDEPAPPASFDIPPFGETDTLPPEPPRVEIPPLQTPAGDDRPPPDYTDEDLASALRPLLPTSSLPTAGGLDPTDLEAMMRAAFRRALAEHAVGAFDRPGFVQRCLWRLDALLSSRSYDEILHEKTRRFRVEEVYLFDRERLSLLSFASVDPARHTSARKVNRTAYRVAAAIHDESGAISVEFPFDAGRRVLVRIGRHCFLAALTRGQPDSFVKADLDYALHRVEEHFQFQFHRGAPVLQELQPMLEECLLIHSPAAPASF